MKRKGVLLADLHCGHRAGLTPPEYWDRGVKWHDVQSGCWDRYTDLVAKIGRVNFVVCNGDAIDGTGYRSGGTELVTADLFEQAKMAAESLALWKAKTYILSYGTDYHVGVSGEDFEEAVADKLREKTNAKVILSSHPFVDIGGVMFDIKHHIGGSSTPYTAGTAILKDKMHNEQWFLDGEGQPLADVVLRAHIHQFAWFGGHRNGSPWLAIRQPALQAAGTKFGGRRCSGVVHWGLIEAAIEDGTIDFTAHICDVSANKTEAIKL